MRLIRFGFIIGMFYAGFYFRHEIENLVRYKDTLDKSFISSMIRCRLLPQKTITLSDLAGREVTIPLPAGTIYYARGTYLTSTTNFDDYFKDALPEYGFSNVERQGATFLVNDKTRTKGFRVTILPDKGTYRTLQYNLR